MTNVCPSLQQHIDRPYDNRTLDVEYGKGIVFDKAGPHAVKMAFTLDWDDRIADVAFRSVRSPVLLGCGSYLTCVLRGRNLEFAQRLRARDVARILQLDKRDERFATMAVTAVQRAVHCWKPSDLLPLDRMRVGTRRAAWVPPPLEAGDQRLLRTGETLDGLRHERTCIYNDLLNLDLVFHVVHNSRADIEGKWLACTSSTLALKATVATLSDPEQKSLLLVGLLGETDREVAADQGVAPFDVLRQIWEVAGRVQRTWRSLQQGQL